MEKTPEKITVRFIAQPMRANTSYVIRCSRPLKRAGLPRKDQYYLVTMTPIEYPEVEDEDHV